MQFRLGKWSLLQALLLAGFALFAACSLHESAQVYTLIHRAQILDQIAPHMGDAMIPDERLHTRWLYAYALIALGFAGLIYRLQTKRDSLPDSAANR